MSNCLQIFITLLICTEMCFSEDLQKFKENERVNLDGLLQTGTLSTAQSANQYTKLFSVSSNVLSSIDKNIFNTVNNLEVFIMNNNANYKFPVNEVFLIHQNLQSVSLDFCSIHAVYNETFSELPNLRSLSMNNNEIEALVGPIFKNNSKLQFLSVNSNKIKIIGPNLLMNKGHFRELHMDLNKNFNFLENKEFQINTNLSVFKCEYCNVTRIDQKTFSKLVNLTQLILNHNNISHIAMKSFQYNDAIEVLMLNNNSLTDLPLDIFSIKNLRILDIDLNKFVPSIDNNLLKAKYTSKAYRSPDSKVDKNVHFENLLSDFVISTTTTTTTISSKPSQSPNLYDSCLSQDTSTSEGISDAFISTYLTLIVVVQILVLILTISCWIKKSREDSSEYIDYSRTVLNEHDIYKTN